MSKKKGIQTKWKNNLTVNGHLWVREVMQMKQRKQGGEAPNRQNGEQAVAIRSRCKATNHL
jgi:hypothetical protein